MSNIKDLLTECEVCTGKYCLRGFRTDRATKERGLVCDKNRRQYFPVQTEQTKLIRDLLYGFVGSQFVLTLYKKTQKDFRCCNFQPYILAVSGSSLAVTTKQ